MNKLSTTAAALVLFAGATAACNRAGTADKSANATGNSASAPASMNAAGTEPAAAAQNGQGEAEVRAFLDQIYAPYGTAGGEGADYDRFLDPQLAAAISATEGGVEADPFIDAQDWTPFKPAYEKIQVQGDRAIATATFTNGDAATRVDYQLMRTPNGWRVYDIQNAAGASLRERFLNAAR